MKLSDFDYELPKELIAQYPLRQRDRCRLMVVDRRDNSVIDDTFANLAQYLRKGDLLVLNDTRVLPARLLGKRHTGGKVEVLLLGRKEGMRFRAMLKPGRLKLNEKISFDSGKISAQVTAKDEIDFGSVSPQEIYAHGVMPLPPYIKRQTEAQDNIYYQTVYARQDGSVAAPTAGLHFTQELLDGLVSRGIASAYVTLHVGPGTFKPVKHEDITAHNMDPEAFFIPQETVQSIEEARRRKGRVFAVGTTSLRALETFSAGKDNGQTDIFIYPGYKFRIVDCLLTNFHLPRTTLFMLVCALGGGSLIRQAYQQAIEKKYRFYSYGDAMLII
jgi:S-adenosylmethionine:tRNA ribosyltransferase-isomerase